LVLFFLMLASTLAEILSLGAVMPFLGILISPERVFANPELKGVIHFMGIDSPSQLVFPLTVTFVALALFAGGCRLILLWFSTRLAFATGADISMEVYRKTLYQPYQVHVSRNTSEVVSGIIHRVNGVVFWILLPLLTLVSSAVLLVAMTFALIAIDPVVAIAAISGFGFSYGIVTLLTRKRLRENGECINEEQTRVIKALQEGLGGIRDVLLDGTQRFYCDLYRQADRRLRRAYGDNNFIGGFPRPTMEALGIVVIAALAYNLGQQEGGISEALPVLGALALGAQRLLPALQQVYGSWANIVGGHAALADTVEILDQKLAIEAEGVESHQNIFNKHLSLNQVSFRYSSNSKYVLKDFNVTIHKGERIAFVGSTGSGKSTVLDILMGLLLPTEGFLSVDGQSIKEIDMWTWQKNIAHVPQSIYLADTTLAENIAFGIPRENIDMNRVREAADRAQISRFVSNHPLGFDANVGERGIQLSGGQRQRIGIARALYKRAKILILDEATSALDNVTEQDVMDSIQGLDRNLTIIIVAHRLTTVRHCDVIYELHDGAVVAKGSYEELLRHSKTFRKMSDVVQN
jgi:ATP-binding cassette subfamily B protein